MIDLKLNVRWVNNEIFTLNNIITYLLLVLGLAYVFGSLYHLTISDGMLVSNNEYIINNPFLSNTAITLSLIYSIANIITLFLVKDLFNLLIDVNVLSHLFSKNTERGNHFLSVILVSSMCILITNMLLSIGIFIFVYSNMQILLFRFIIVGILFVPFSILVSLLYASISIVCKNSQTGFMLVLAYLFVTPMISLFVQSILINESLKVNLEYFTDYILFGVSYLLGDIFTYLVSGDFDGQVILIVSMVPITFAYYSFKKYLNMNI